MAPHSRETQCCCCGLSETQILFLPLRAPVSIRSQGGAFPSLMGTESWSQKESRPVQKSSKWVCVVTWLRKYSPEWGLGLTCLPVTQTWPASVLSLSALPRACCPLGIFAHVLFPTASWGSQLTPQPYFPHLQDFSVQCLSSAAGLKPNHHLTQSPRY